MLRFKKWCHKWPGAAVMIIVFLSTVVVVFGVLGVIAKFKLDTANTNLWAARQEISQMRTDAQAQVAEYEDTIERLRDQLTVLRGEKAAEMAMENAEALTPDEVYKFTGVGGVRISVNGEEAPNVRPSPRVSEVSYGKMVPGSFTLEYFYSAPRTPQEGIGNWIGIPLHLLSDTERNLFPADIQDKDGVIWVSADYLKFSDWLKNYPATKVNLATELVSAN